MGGSLFMAGGTNQWQWALHGVAARIHRKKSKKKNEEEKKEKKKIRRRIRFGAHRFHW